MTGFRRKTIVLVATAIAFAGALLWSGSGNNAWRVCLKSQARIGRPFTPMSYAGVARRTTRRAVAGAAVVGGAVAAGCFISRPPARQVVDAYGRVYTRC